MRYSLNGHIVADGDAPILRWWGIPASCPADIRGALAQNPEGEEFVLEINSGGGSVFAGFEMYSLLRNASRQGVHTRAEVQSLAGSAASVVMAGADTAAVSPVGQVMIHLPSTITEGNQGVHRESVQMLESITESIIAAYEGKVRGKTSHDALRRLMDRETFLSARAALGAAARRAGKSGEHLQCRRRPARHGQAARGVHRGDEEPEPGGQDPRGPSR